MVWLVWLMACATGPTATPETLEEVDDAFCALAADCWQVYPSRSVCLADNAVAQEDCVHAPEAVMTHCAAELQGMASECVDLSRFAYPASCSAFCAP